MHCEAHWMETCGIFENPEGKSDHEKIKLSYVIHIFYEGKILTLCPEKLNCFE